MIRFSSFLIALLVLVLAAAARPAERKPEKLDSVWLGEQVAGARTTEADLDGRVVLVYAWCVS